MKPRIRLHLGYWIAALGAILLLQLIAQDAGSTRLAPYSEFVSQLRQGLYSEVQVSSGTFEARLKQPDAEGHVRVLTQRVDEDAQRLLADSGLPYRAVVENHLLRDVASWVLPALVFLAVWLWLLPRLADKQGLGGGLMSVGKSKAKVYVETDTRVRFADVAGVDEAKAELQEIVNFLKAPAQYGRLGARLPKGVLLVGPPGTGKTLLARAVAGEAGVPFFSINGSEFVEMFVGVGAARVRDLFEQARARAPAIIFIDELDALGRARGVPGYGGHDEKEQTLNQLLSELDGFDSSQGLVLVAATNRPEILDPALLRAGRFDRQVLVDRPDKAGRLQVLQVHVRRLHCAPELELEAVAALTPGFSGADLANLANEAALTATRRGAEAVTQDDFTQALERIVAGLEKKSRLMNPHERRVVAYHELGHAFVGLALGGGERVHKVSIIPRGIGALGYTIRRPTEDRYLMSRQELEDRMAVLLAGRAAEELAFMDISTGASDDLTKASDIARAMVLRYGMDAELGPVSYEDEAPSALLMPQQQGARERVSERVQERIDESVRTRLGEAKLRATHLLGQRWSALEAAVERLLQQETLGERELLELFSAPAGLTGVKETRAAGG